MSEIAETFGALRQMKAEKRTANREYSSQILRDHGINYLTRNEGAHLIVQHNSREWDFWPGTGKWKERGSTNYYRGVFNLINATKEGTA